MSNANNGCWLQILHKLAQVKANLERPHGNEMD